jgi:hypothetical protein
MAYSLVRLAPGSYDVLRDGVVIAGVQAHPCWHRPLASLLLAGATPALLPHRSATSLCVSSSKPMS